MIPLGKNRKGWYLTIAVIAVLASRMPFLFDGYGVEEDSWGIAVAAKNTLETGVWEASRLPGHPLNEAFYLLLFPCGPVALNFLSALCSALLIIPLVGIFNHTSCQHSLIMSFGFLFIPVVFINSTCTLDYVWGLLFFVSSINFMLKNKSFAAWTMLALATGCRITYAGFAVPFLYYFLQNFSVEEIKRAILQGLFFFILVIILYSPVFYVYGWSFFDYSDQFPYPSAAKVLYKASIGVFGLPLFLFLLALVPLIGKSFSAKRFDRLMIFLILGFVLQLISYLSLPQKSAYLMPASLFLWIGLSRLSIRHLDRGLLIAGCISCFLLGVNVADANRGVGSDSANITFRIQNQELTLDFFRGHLVQDMVKRRNKTRFVNEVLRDLQNQKQPMVLICGWWYNQVLIQQGWGLGIPPMVELNFYPEKEHIRRWKNEGRVVFHLPEQDLYADLSVGGDYFRKNSLLFKK